MSFVKFFITEEKEMNSWTFFTLLLLFNFGSCAEEISAHVHVAVNDQWVVFAKNRDKTFHYALSPYQTSAEILHLNYSSLGTEIIRSLFIPVQPSPLGLLELVFIGGSRNSSERILFHVKLRKDPTGLLSPVHLTKTSITSLSSPGIESALGMHPLSTYVVAIGDRSGYIYDMNQSNGFPWSSWEESTNGHYPKAVSVTMDNFIIVGANVQLVDTIIPALYISLFDPEKNVATPLIVKEEFHEMETTSIGAPMSLAPLSSIDTDYLLMIVGFPSADAVFLIALVNGELLFKTFHQSKEKGINFGHTVIFSDNQTYGVLSTALATLPWSTGRVQVCSIL